MRTEKLRRAVFLDRDGTVNEEKEYLYRIEDFVFIDGVPEAIRLLRNAGFLVIVITNQSGIGRGFYSEEDLHALHRYADSLLAAAGTRIDGWYFCPHHPEHGLADYRQDCECRKPLPGMITSAATELSVDLTRSFVIGDKRSDIEAGESAGCTAIMVRTGYGEQEVKNLPPDVIVCRDLLEAAVLIVGTDAGKAREDTL